MAAVIPNPVRNRRVGLIALAAALAMLALGFAAVPLYRMFCQATGYGGTTQRATAAEAALVKAAGRKIRVRFDGNVEAGMPWTFGPDQVSQDMKIGERRLAYFHARNTSDKPITGVASFNVQPAQAGLYFKKIQCFCFNQQTLLPGQTVEMPVNYFVDPAILNDPETADFQEITLSYTFHVSPDQSAAVKAGAKALDPAQRAR